MQKMPKADALIIGLGAAGGVAANVLAQAGIKVVGLEAGPRLDVSDFVPRMDEIAMSTYHWTGAPKFNNEIPTWRPDAKSPTQAPPIPAVPMANMVGGTSIHYGTQSWRFRSDDFTVRSDTIAKYGEEALPKGSTTVDWPVSYNDLEPYYDNVEYAIGVSGEAGVNPFESPRVRPYPLPPLRDMGYGKMMAEAWDSLGYHPFHQPSAIISQDYKNRPACTYCGFCSPTGCWNDAKSSTLVSTIRDAEATGNLEIRPNCRVLRINSNDSGQVTGVTYLDSNGNEVQQDAGFVILSTYVYENVRLLLLSTSDHYPNGLVNSNGQVGKNYMSHAYVGRQGLFPGKRLNVWSGTNGQAMAMDDLNGDNFDHTGLGFIRGAVIFASNGVLPIGQSRVIPSSVPAWGPKYKSWLHENAGSVGMVFAQVEPQPYEDYFLDLDPNVKDPLGLPVVRVTYSLGDNEVKAGQYIDQKLDEMLKAAGATETWPGFPAGIPVPINSHAYGGTRMGTDDTAAVVDQFGISFESRNFAILGGSNFPGSSGYNPTETIEALAWFASDYIAENFDDLAL